MKHEDPGQMLAHNEEIRFVRGESDKGIFRRRPNLSLSQIELWVRSHSPAIRTAGGGAGVWERMEVDLVFSRRASEVNLTL